MCNIDITFTADSCSSKLTKPNPRELPFSSLITYTMFTRPQLTPHSTRMQQLWISTLYNLYAVSLHMVSKFNFTSLQFRRAICNYRYNSSQFSSEMHWQVTEVSADVMCCIMPITLYTKVNAQSVVNLRWLSLFNCWQHLQQSMCQVKIFQSP